MPGVYLDGSLVKVVNRCVITSVLNTTEKQVKMPEPLMVTEVDTGDPLILHPNSPAECDKSRYERFFNKLRMGHLNSEEKTSLGEICFDNQDVFFLHGDRLSCTSAVKQHSPRTRDHPNKYTSMQTTVQSKERNL